MLDDAPGRTSGVLLARLAMLGWCRVPDACARRGSERLLLRSVGLEFDFIPGGRLAGGVLWAQQNKKTSLMPLVSHRM